jgi:tetratricopeptide (TPR) repeat protein
MLLLAERFADANAVAQTIAVPQFRNYIEARVLLENGDPLAALEKFEVVLANWPNNAASRYYAAIASEEVGDFPAAIESYRYAIRAGPESTDARLRLARLHRAAGDYERANAALAAGSGHLDVQRELRIEGMRIVGRFGSGEEIRQRLAQHRGKPTSADAYVAVAAGLYDRSGAETAQALLEGLDLTRPASAALLRASVGYLGELGRHDEALELAAAALAQNPDFGLFHEIQGRALSAAGREGAQAAFERAVQRSPQNAQVLEGLGQAAADAGNADTALGLYARAAVSDTEWARPDRAAAELLLSLDRDTEAEERLEAVLERDPYGPWAASRLAELLLARGADPQRSLALARRAVYCGGGEEAEALLARAAAGAPAAAATP